MSTKIKKRSSQIKKTENIEPEKKVEHKNVKKVYDTNNWKLSTIVLGVLLILSIFTGGFRLKDDVVRDVNAVNSMWSNFKALFSPKDNNVNLDAEVIITEYSDFECPYCQRAYPTVNQLKEKYGDKIAFEFKHFPLSFHANAQKAGEASECARDQGKFWEYHDVLFETKQLDVNSLKKHAADLGLNSAKFNACLDNGDKTSKVQQDFQEGQQAGVRGTPTFFINGNPLVGAQPIANFEAIIDKLLAGEEIVQPEAEPAPTPVVAVKSDKPNVELFIMSHCPYGTQIEKGILPVVSVLKDDIDFDLNFVYYAMHGEVEVKEQLSQYCIQRDQKELLQTYLLCFLEAGDGAGCLAKTGVDMKQLASCEAEVDEEYDVMANLADQASWLSGRYPLFNTDKADNEKYGVGGSPTLVINGQTVSSARDSASLLKAVCDRFNTKPAACNTEFSSAAPGPGFGFDTAGAANNAAAGCGV